MMLSTCLVAQAASSPTLEKLRGKLNGLDEIENPFRRQIRWEAIKRDLPAVATRMAKDRKDNQLVLERKWQRLVELRNEVQQLQGELQVLETDDEAGTAGEQPALVLEYCQEESARIEVQLKQLYQRRDRLKEQGARRQLGEIEQLIARMELQHRCVKDRETIVQERPEAAARLAIEADLQKALNRLTNVEIALAKGRLRSQSAEKEMRLWLQFQQDLWFERFFQIEEMLKEIESGYLGSRTP